MKLNPDCIRDILISVEDATSYGAIFAYSLDDKDHEILSKYDNREVFYHIRQCKMAGLLAGVQFGFGGELVTVTDLTPAGHEFLANTRKSVIWESVKTVAGELGSDSLAALLEIAKNTVANLIKKHFEKQNGVT